MVSIETLVAGAIGGLVANLSAEFLKSLVRRQQSEERRRSALYEEIQQSVDNLKDSGLRYWAKSPMEMGEDYPILRASLVGQQQNLSECITDMFSGDPKRDCDMATVDFFNVLTGGDFYDPGREASETTLIGIHQTALKLKRQIRLSKERDPWKPLS